MAGNPFVEGITAAKEQSQQNPFNLILGRFQEAQARRYKEDSERKKEEAELTKALMQLRFERDYNMELQKIKAEGERKQKEFEIGEERKTGLLESLRKGEVKEVPDRQVATAMGKPVFEGQTIQEAGREGVFEGTPFGMAGKRFKATPKTAFRSIADISDLTSEQQLQGRALARKIYGVRGADYGLPAVYEEMRKGKSVDEIEDSLRYSGQSKEFAGSVRDAAQTILIKESPAISQSAMDSIDDYLSKGNIGGVQSQLKRLAIKETPAAEQTMITTKERTIKFLDEIQGDLNKFEQLGGDTNIFTGTAESFAKKAGTVINPEARKIATKIQALIQRYRLGVTGQAFGMIENKEYKDMFPSIKNTGKLNTATIDGLREVFTGDLDSFYSLSMGEENYRKLFGKEPQTRQSQNMVKIRNKKTGEVKLIPRSEVANYAR